MREPEIRHVFNLWQFGGIVASVDASSLEVAMREINHYAAVYSQDGPVEIVPKGGKPKRTEPATDKELRRLWGMPHA